MLSFKSSRKTSKLSDNLSFNNDAKIGTILEIGQESRTIKINCVQMLPIEVVHVTCIGLVHSRKC